MNLERISGTGFCSIGRLLLKFSVKHVLILCFVMMCSMSLSAQTLTVRENGTPLQQVIEKIKKQTGYDYLWDMDLIKKAKPVTINLQNAPLEDVLKKISESQEFDLILSDKTILIRPKAGRRTPAQRTSERQQQSRYTLVGNITDDEGKPLEGATIRVKRSNNLASVTAEDGSYSLEVFPDSEIQVTMIGFEPRSEMLYGKNHLNLQLRRIENRIEETVVTGYGSRKKESFTGASTTITRKDLEKYNNRNIFSIIQTIDPAFKIAENNNQGSNPNVLPDIKVRGQNMVSGSDVDVRAKYALNSPLILMDGFQVDLQRLYDLDVNRIESITLLKDAAATALYGSRGANGVLVIETRLPKQGKFTISYSLQPSTTVVDLSDYNLMNAAEKLEYELLAGVYNSSYIPEQEKLRKFYSEKYLDVASGVNTDWLYQPVQTTTSFTHALRVEGGNEQVRYSIDGNYGDTKGAIKESGRTRAGAGFTLFYRLADKITFRNVANLINSRANGSPYGSLSTYAGMNPYFRIHDASGNLIRVYNEDFATELNDNNYLRYNPLFDASLPFKDYANTTNISNNLNVEVFITPTFRINATGVISKTFEKGESFLSPRHSFFYTTPLIENKGRYTFSSGDAMEYFGALRLNYGKTFGKHVINLLGNTEVKAISGSSTSYIATGFVDDEIITPNMANKYAADTRPSYASTVNRLFGALLSGTYIYDDRLVLEGNYRVDGSSTFGRENRYTGFWSAGAAYNLHKEKFLENSVVSMLRVFGNYGLSGADSFSPRMTATAYETRTAGLYFKLPGINYLSEGNAFLKWPKIYSLSLGVEGTLWGDRLNFRFNHYNKKTTDMVSEITIAPSVGLEQDSYFENLGEVHNTGYEGYVNVQAYSNPNSGFSWYINASGVRNFNKLTKVSDALKKLNDQNNNDYGFGYIPQTPYYEEGQSLNNIKGMVSLGIDPMSGRELYMTRNGQVTYDWSTSEIQVLANTDPKLEGMIGTIINYKGLSLQAQMHYVLGQNQYNQTLIDKVENSNPAFNADRRVLTDRWKQPGDEAMFKAIDDQRLTQLSSRFIQKENTFRLAALNLNYEVNQDFVSRLKLQRARLNFSMNDLFRFSTIRMERGTDYPYARTFNFGISVVY